MKIVKIIGGLGNQMFQYALYIALKQRFPNEKVMVDTSYFKTYHRHNGLELNRVFGVELPQATWQQLLQVTWPVGSYKLSRFIRKYLPKRKTETLQSTDWSYRPDVFSAGNRYYDGYWLNWRYFIDYKDLITDAFQFHMPLNRNTRELLDTLSKDTASVSLHIRRGDYIGNKLYEGICTESYYKSTINFVIGKIETPHFYLFSDDIAWCKDQIIPLLDGSHAVIVDWNKGTDSALDMLLMSRCRHSIVANSSFSWWGAFLNRHPDKIICAPKRWINTPAFDQIQMPGWWLF